MPEPARILVVTAHPDDVDFGAAGSVATWTDAGIEVVYCIVTDGDAGGFDPSIGREEMAAIRRVEQTEAAKVVGVTEVHFLGHPDGRLLPTLELRRDISRVIRRARPDRVVCQSPERNYQRIFASHPDHLAAGEATLCAVYPDSRNQFAFPELLGEGWEPHTVREVWMMGGPSPDVHVDVTDTVERKVEALRRHASQTSHMNDLDGMIRGWLARTAEAFALPAGRLAEGFRRIETA